MVLAPGDLNLTFKSYVRDPVTLRLEDDHVVAIEGEGLDADLLRSHLAAFGEEDAYAVSHVGWGMNHGARWDYLPLYDRSQVNGTEARAFAGNVLFSTGANENAGRFTRAHFDLPLRRCTVTLDGRAVVTPACCATSSADGVERPLAAAGVAVEPRPLALERRRGGQDVGIGLTPADDLQAHGQAVGEARRHAGRGVAREVREVRHAPADQAASPARR